MTHRIILLAALSIGCSRTECINEDGCDTGVEEAGPVGPVTVIFDWVTPAAFEVLIDGVDSAKLGIAETGLGGTGYYLEDCVSAGARCHELSEGTNTFVSQQEKATGEPWDGVLENGQTALHQESEENLTYAVWTTDGSCLAVEGHDVTYYEPHDCVNLP